MGGEQQSNREFGGYRGGQTPLAKRRRPGPRHAISFQSRRDARLEAPPAPSRRPEYQREGQPAGEHRRRRRRLLDAVLKFDDGVDELRAAVLQDAAADQPREHRSQYGAADRRKQVGHFFARQLRVEALIQSHC